MRRFNPVTGKFIAKRRFLQKFEPYFCPYCEVVFVKNENAYQLKTNRSDINHFSCSECKQDFTEETFILEKRKRTNYKLSSSYSENPNAQDVIKEEILKLHKEGYSQRNIIEITKFPKSIIEEYTKTPKKALASISVKRFKKEYLKISDEMEKDYQIVSAIEFGCTVRQIRKLFKVGNDKINDLRINQKMKILRKNKIKIEGEKVKIFKLSQLS